MHTGRERERYEKSCTAYTYRSDKETCLQTSAVSMFFCLSVKYIVFIQIEPDLVVLLRLRRLPTANAWLNAGAPTARAAEVKPKPAPQQAAEMVHAPTGPASSELGNPGT